MVVKKLVGGYVVVVVVVVGGDVIASGVSAFGFDGGIRDYRLWGKGGGGEYPVGRCLSADLAVVMTEYVCSSVSCVCDFLLKSLNYDFLGFDCFVASLYEQLDNSDAGSTWVSVWLLTRGRNCDESDGPSAGQLSQ